MSAENDKLPISIVSSSLCHDDIHYELRNIFFNKMKECFDKNEMIHMDAVSDAFDETISKFIKDDK